MPYGIIQPPSTLKFHEMSKQELVDYGRWFHASAPERMSQLEDAVQSTRGYESWVATCEPDSLDFLGEWLAAEVRIRPRNKDEIAELQSGTSLLASPSTWT
jgi:hypothetical protein